MAEIDSEASPVEDLRSSDPRQVLASIRDQAVMLGMAAQFLCEARVLSNLGAALEKDIERLKASVDLLRGKFVGLPPQDMDMDARLEELFLVSERLKRPETSAQGPSGLEALSKEFKEKVRAFGAALDSFQQKLDGEPAPYTPSDYVVHQWDRLGTGISAAAALGRRLAKAALTIVLCAGILFLVLYFTMEKDEAFLKEIETAKAQIDKRQSELVKTEAQLREIERQLTGVRSGELSREEKVHVLELNTKARDLRQEKDRLQIEAKGLERALEEAQGRLDALRKKTLLERLLRR